MRKQRGLSMVELMVAMVLGLMIVSAVLQTFISAKRGYEMQHELARIQENGRFAMEYLKRDIRQADFWGCLTGALGNIDNNLNSGSAPEFMMSEGVSGAESSGYVTQNGRLNANIASDMILLRGGSDEGYKVVPPFMPTPGGALHIEAGAGIEQGDILLLSDCKSGEIFQVTSPPSTGGNGEQTLTHGTGGSVTPGNADKDFQKSYQGDASIFRAGSIQYEIKVNGFNEPALYRNDQELVEGIESMQIKYGIDTDNDRVANYFDSFDPDKVDDAVSVQVSLLVRGYKDNVADSNFTLDYNDTSYTTQDRRLRKVFTSTIALRNRLK